MRYQATVDFQRPRRYGISQGEYDRLRQKQKGKCAACKKIPDPMAPSPEHVLQIDHSHKTGLVRGLLCSRCNRSLGLLEDNPNKVRGLLRYLKREAV